MFINIYEEIEMNELLISVIIPAHNSEKDIERCILSVINQTYKNIEIIIVENGSKDSTYEVCQKLVKKYKNIILLKEEEGNVSNARNKGLEVASGDYITFADSDDYYEKVFFENVDYELNTEKVDILVTGFSIDNGTSKTKIVENKEILRWNNEEFIVRNFVDPKIMGVCWNRIYKKDVLQNKKFDKKIIFMQDSHFNVNVVSSNRNLSIKYKNITDYIHVANINSETSRVNNMFNDDEIRYVMSVKASLHDFNLTKNEQIAARAALANLNVITFSILVKNKNNLVNYREKVKNAEKYFYKNLLYFVSCKYIDIKTKLIGFFASLYLLIK